MDDNWALKHDTRDRVAYFPSGSAVAATWNPGMAYLTGAALGQEARGRGKDVILGPSLNIKRSPLCGRNFEYMSEDPVLTAAQGTAYIEGVQESDVAACPKHFAANSQETDRLDVDESIGERALRELYYPAFRAAVRDAQTLTIMGAYNLINGVHCCESKELLDDILRDEWGFKGRVVSDWSALHETKASAEVGLDVDMCVTNNFDDFYFARPLLEAVRAGEISERDVDLKVEHVLAVMDALNMLGEARESREPGCYATLGHAQDALTVARESVTLLKNDAGTLPLDARGLRRVLVVGANADRVHSVGGGSAVVKAVHEISPIQGLCGRLGGNVEVEYAPGYWSPKVMQDDTWQEDSLENSVADAKRDAERAAKLRDEAVAKAREYAASGDPVIYIGGLDHEHDLEGRDRETMDLPYGQDELIDALLDAAPDAVIVLVAGSPVTMDWEPRARTLVWNWYNGAESGNALADVLLGNTEPSGHLPETFPVKLADCPANSIGTFGLVGHVDYTEELYVGYRYYQTKDVPVRFCFGHGLTYTSFRYEDLEVERLDGDVRVQMHITNTGERLGAAVPQVYLRLEGTGEDRPAYELKGFEKTWLEPGERAEIDIRIPERDVLGYWSLAAGGWKLAPRAKVFVGESVGDIRLEGRLD
ncbi:MAG: glycoside hydrolase family 3 C-terminal domain-containing protein [Bifidobacterium sp.]|nr:glycoside hydrolase family 3 C-terminal domain-containing protein [Bifidobacterium sp.]